MDRGKRIGRNGPKVTAKELAEQVVIAVLAPFLDSSTRNKLAARTCQYLGAVVACSDLVAQGRAEPP